MRTSLTEEYHNAFAQVMSAADDLYGALIKAGFNPSQPRDWHGRWSDTGRGYSRHIILGSSSEDTLLGGADSVPQTWGDPKKFDYHVEKHKGEFGIKSPKEYAHKAREFMKRAFKEKLPMVVSKDGVIHTYDPKTNTFAAYNKNRTTRTFFKPKEGIEKYARIEKEVVKKGGKIIRPLRSGGGRSGGGGLGGGVGEPFDYISPIDVFR